MQWIDCVTSQISAKIFVQSDAFIALLTNNFYIR